jgi:ABC-type lipoprotein export system ATPase subunit/ABC-type antimicrobial peptide transport system permease subunit
MIELKEITKKYGSQSVLEGFSYTFQEKGITCLIGASGSGKSTLFNLLAGFDREYEGEITVDGQVLSQQTEETLCQYRKQTIGFVFQEYHLLTGYTVLENILLAAQLTCRDLSKNVEKALYLLRRLNLEEKANEKTENLSGGQKQRVAIARALVRDPKLILADEPTGALDRRSADEIMAIFSEISKTCPVVIITHDRKICDYADNVITIENGKCRVLKSMDELPYAAKVQQAKPSAVPVSMIKRALRNFQVYFKRFLGISLAAAVAICAVLLSFSSQNIIEERIRSFEEKNTAFSWGKIALENDDKTTGQVLDLLRQSPEVKQFYLQYPVPASSLKLQEKCLSVPGKEFGTVSAESMNIGVMPAEKEIAITPSLAKQFAEDIRTLIGKNITFTCGDFSRELTISGIYSASFDDYYLDAKTEQALYDTLQEKKSPVSVAYQVQDFNGVIQVAAELTEQGFPPAAAVKQVESLQDTFESLQTLFVLVSVFILLISLAICGLLLVKLVRMRAGEIGLLMALGYERGQIGKMLFWESLLLSALSVLTTSLLVCFLSALPKEAVLHIDAIQFVSSICGAVFLVWFITFLASRKLLQTDPAKVLRE